MRTLNDYFLPMGSVDIGAGSAGPSSSPVIVPDGGMIVGVSYNTTEAIDAAVGASIRVNGAHTSPDPSQVDFPITAVNTGGFAFPDMSIYVDDNDSVVIDPVAGATTGICDCTLIIRR